MLMTMKHLFSYMTVITGLFMCALVGTISIASDTVGLILLIASVSALATVLSLIEITHPAAPPYSVALLFRQVRIKLGLSSAVTNIVKNEQSNEQGKITYLTIPRHD